MDRKDDQEHWRPARRSFIASNTRVQGWSWRIPAHFLQTFGNVQYHLSVYRRCSVSVQTAQFLWYFKPVLHPSVDYCGLSVLFELLHVVRSRMTERIVMATESCTHKKTRENMTVYLQLWIFLVFFLTAAMLWRHKLWEPQKSKSRWWWTGKKTQQKCD